jgi:hypothetical protein
MQHSSELQTRSLIREGALKKQDCNFQTYLVISPRVGSTPRHTDWLTDWPTVSRKVTSTLTSSSSQSFIGQSSRKSVIAESSRQNSRRREEAGEITVIRCACGMWTVREPGKGNIHLWKPVPEDWCGTADWEDQARVDWTVKCEK